MMMMMSTSVNWNLIREPLGTSDHKERAVVAIGETPPQEKRATGRTARPTAEVTRKKEKMVHRSAVLDEQPYGGEQCDR
jgi:hypothetical protein